MVTQTLGEKTYSKRHGLFMGVEARRRLSLYKGAMGRVTADTVTLHKRAME